MKCKRPIVFIVIGAALIGCEPSQSPVPDFRSVKAKADQGDISAQTEVGLCFRDGIGVAKDESSALEWFRKAAQQGGAEAQYQLAKCYTDGRGTAKDEQTAIRWLKSAADQAHSDAQVDLAARYLTGGGVAKDEVAAIKYLRDAANRGVARAQAMLGGCYRNGRGVERDEKTAVSWSFKAAEQGYAPAQARVGWCFGNGIGIEKDERAAISWYRKAAAQGDPFGQCGLGLCYETGTGVERDQMAAFSWYQKAAEQGDSDGETALGWCFENGFGVDKDVRAAANWYRKAAEGGNALGQYRFAIALVEGIGVAVNETAAVELFRKSAEQGLDCAQHMLGTHLRKGLGCGKDDSEAVSWFRKSATQGYAPSQRELGICLSGGSGVEADQMQAEGWLRKAADQGDRLSSSIIERVLSWAQVLESDPDPRVVTDSNFRRDIQQTGLPWRVRTLESGIEMLLVPAGEFVMGKSIGDALAQPNELPPRMVRISKPFYLGRFEVTERQYLLPPELEVRLAALQQQGYTRSEAEGIAVKSEWAPFPKPSSPIGNLPARRLDWDDCAKYCERSGLRLPTEAEWEFACRGGLRAPRYGDLKAIAFQVDLRSIDYKNLQRIWEDQAAEVGGELLPRFGLDGVKATIAVGSRAPNSLGFFDMLGNVSEWVHDNYRADYYSIAPSTDPEGPSKDGEHWLGIPLKVVRGGCSLQDADTIRASARFGLEAHLPPPARDTKRYWIGFRVAKTP